MNIKNYIKFIGSQILYIFITTINPSEELQLEIVKINDLYFEYIIQKLGKNPSKNIQKTVIDNNYRAVQYIIDSDEEIKLYSVKKCIYTIKYIKNASKNVLKYTKDKAIENK